MPIDPGILFNVKSAQTPLPSENLARALSLKQLVRQDQSGDLQLKQQQDQVAKGQQIQQAIMDAGGDLEKALPRIMQIDTTIGQAAAKHLEEFKTAQLGREKTQSDIGKTNADAAKTQDELRNSRLKNLASSLSGLKPEQIPGAYARARRDLGAVLGTEAPPDLAGFESAVGMPFAEYLSTQVGPQNPETLTVDGVVLDKRTMKPLYTSPAATAPKRVSDYINEKGEQVEVLQHPDGRLEPRVIGKAGAPPRAQVPGTDIPLPADVEAQRKRMNAARAQQNGLSPTQFNQVQTLSRKFDDTPTVKDFNVVMNKKATMEGLLSQPLGGAGDLSAVYEFMKALDPTSVVRESEYASASKAGNIFAGALARFNGYLKPEGGFLSPQLKQAFMKIIDQKFDVTKRQVKALYDDYARRADNITKQPGTGADYLTDYSTVYDTTSDDAANPYGAGAPENPYRNKK